MIKNIDIFDEVELSGIFSIPGEGLVAELNCKQGTYLYDRQGLQYRIVKKQQLGLDSSVEQMALSRISNNKSIVYG